MTLAELKRRGMHGGMNMEFVSRFGKSGEGIPERLRGKRRVVKVGNSGGKTYFVLMNDSGVESRLDGMTAALMDCNGETLTIYSPGVRELTDDEKSLLAEWDRVQAEFLKRNPYNDTYWKRADFFRNSRHPYLFGGSIINGKYYDHNGKVRDNKIKGEVSLVYRIYFE